MDGEIHDILPTDDDLHRRESEWLTFIEKLETAAEMLAEEENDENELEDALAEEAAENNSSNDEEGAEMLDEDADAIDSEEDDEEDDYHLFTEMLAEARKAIVERKRLWEETGDSFVLDHFSETMSVHEWLKQHQLGDSGSNNMDVSKMYGNMCKRIKQMQSTFLEATLSKESQATPRRKSRSVEPETSNRLQSTVIRRTPLAPFNDNREGETGNQKTPSKKSEQNCLPQTPKSAPKPPLTGKSMSESTHNRRRLNGGLPPLASIGIKKRGFVSTIRRLSTVEESPSNLASTVRRTASIGGARLPRERTVIYSPMQPMVQDRFKDVLKLHWFDPNRTLVYEPPSDADGSSESDDDIFLSCKRKYGGRITEV